MASCEELAEEIAGLQQALIVDDAAVQAAQNVRYAHQMQLWYAQYNFYLQGCGGGGGGGGSGSGLSIAAAMSVEQYTIPARRPDELLLIMAIPDLRDLHQRAENLGAFRSKA